jgi:itaconyl-CoA hydratase
MQLWGETEANPAPIRADRTPARRPCAGRHIERRFGGDSMSAVPDAPKQWLGRFLEDFEVGDRFRSRLGRTISEADNTWFTLLTMNTNQVHFNVEYARGTEFERPLVVSSLTLAIVLGLSVADTSENAVANLGWEDIKLVRPVFAGDTLWAETEILGVRASRSREGCGIIEVRTRGVNQDGEVVLEFRRSFMIFKRAAAAAVTAKFPLGAEDWRV